MQAVVKTLSGPGAEFLRVPVHPPGPGEALIEVRAASICGTDYHVYAWDAWAAQRVRLPRVMGHETAGIVAELGSPDSEVSVGDHVSVETHITCGHCHACRTGQSHICERVEILGVDHDGAFADYLVVPVGNLWKNPAELPFEIAAAQEPMGNAVHAVFSGEITGQSVLITGLGPIGLFAVGLCRAAGSGQIIGAETNAFRRELGLRMGADLVLDPLQDDIRDWARQRTGGEGVDVVLEMSGNPQAIREGIRSARRGGRISLLGIPSCDVCLPLNEEVILRGLTLQGITGRRIYETWYRTRALLESGRLDIAPLITHRLPLGRYDEAMQILQEGNCGKIVLLPQIA